MAEWAALQAVSRAVDTRSLVRLWMVSDAAGAVCIFRACIGRSVLARRAARRTATLVDPVCALRPGVVSTASLVYFQTLTTLMPERRPCVWGLVPCAARPPWRPPRSLSLSQSECVYTSTCVVLEAGAHTVTRDTDDRDQRQRERDTHDLVRETHSHTSHRE